MIKKRSAKGLSHEKESLHLCLFERKNMYISRFWSWGFKLRAHTSWQCSEQELQKAKQQVEPCWRFETTFFMRQTHWSISFWSRLEPPRMLAANTQLCVCVWKGTICSWCISFPRSIDIFGLYFRHLNTTDPWLTEHTLHGRRRFKVQGIGPTYSSSCPRGLWRLFISIRPMQVYYTNAEWWREACEIGILIYC